MRGSFDTIFETMLTAPSLSKTGPQLTLFPPVSSSYALFGMENDICSGWRCTGAASLLDIPTNSTTPSFKFVYFLFVF
jgi:hypothetical protein